MASTTKERRRPLLEVHRLPLRILLAVPVYLALTAVILLATHSDLNIPALYSQCHSRSRLRGISRIPVIGAPACFIISFLRFANASVRTFAQMSVVLSFVGALLTVNLIESARRCNRRSWVIRNPTLGWLVFNLIGGTLVWDLLIVPAFLRRAQEVRDESLEAGRAGGDALDRDSVKASRGLESKAEAYAIPIAMTLGFYVPSILMLTLNEPISIAVWLLFPLLISLARIAVRFAVSRLSNDDKPFHLESYRASSLMVYAVPFICSVLAHGFLIWNMFSRDDRREMTRSTIVFIHIDISILAATVVYWVLVECGSVPALFLAGLSILLGPGAALCFAWLLREQIICTEAVLLGECEGYASEGDPQAVRGKTPLLR
ncbi:Uu.00g083180.m01.CDS01 [Anthostomella pinea]|uniref:Uu.00g083180.m01.CDS01 n=1 Tax=Anthostomella pinea TaxID=933095 RepID=A0AAI8VM50_9PEZI|nr:Uu.00g083180.m01.CDS01 [Anthostomella pinea]